jgi:aromatic-L-amino-acid/L-tryptophan decarboxylase
VVCFRYAPLGHDESRLEALNARLMQAVNESGEIFISHTKIDGRYALRLAIGNLRTTRADVEHAWHVLQREAALLPMSS